MTNSWVGDTSHIKYAVFCRKNAKWVGRMTSHVLSLSEHIKFEFLYSDVDHVKSAIQELISEFDRVTLKYPRNSAALFIDPDRTGTQLSFEKYKELILSFEAFPVFIQKASEDASYIQLFHSDMGSSS